MAMAQEDLAELMTAAADVADAETPAESIPPADPAPTPDPAPLTTPPGGPVPTDPTPSSPTELAALRQEIATLKQEQRLWDERHQYTRRELELLRAAQPAAPPGPDPVQETLQAIQVSEDDLAELFQGGPKGAALATRALQLAVVRAVQLAETRLVGMYRAEQAQAQQQTQQGYAAQQQYDQFWAEHGDLRPHERVVKAVAAEVAAEQSLLAQRGMPQRTWDQARTEVATRTREILSGFRVGQPAPVGAAAIPGVGQPPLTRRAPAGEMGGGVGRGGATSQFQREFGDLLQ